MISAALVKELREITGAGMMDCKKALVETNGNLDEAVTWLRENGIMKAQKKAVFLLKVFVNLQLTEIKLFYSK